MQDLAVKTKWPMMRKEWTPCCAFHWMQFSNNNNNNNIDSLILSAFLSSMRLFFFSASSSQLLSPPAVRSCHNLQDESTTWLLKETETKSQFNYSKKFKQTRKVHMKQKKSSSKSGEQSMNNNYCLSTEVTGGIWSEIFDRYKERFVESIRTSPQVKKRIQTLEYWRNKLKILELTRNALRRSKSISPTSITSMKPYLSHFCTDCFGTVQEDCCQ